MTEQENSWIHRQLERLAETRPDLVEAIVQRAMLQDSEFRWAMVVGAYLDGQINLGKAAELLGMHRIELQRLFLEKGIPLRMGPEDTAEALAEAKAWST
jgi:predicted HTH domain antitoxin